MNDLERIYDKIKTPYKYGAVIKDNDYFVDSPSVFKFNGKWYMYYIAISKDVKESGYETHISSSDDLLHWHYEGRIFERNEGNSWDSKQCAGYGAFIDMNFGGSNEIQKVNDKYYITYLGGGSDGYEPDPLQMGMAYSYSPVTPASFRKFKNPVLSPFDKDAREFEKKTIYKGNMLIDEAQTLGHKYINIYNAKPDDDRERIYMAVSDDGEHWQRYGNEPLINEVGTIKDLKISGDPQVVKLDNIYVMFYFRAIKSRDGFRAYNTFAVSEDLVHWSKWKGKPLVESEYPWENVFAHKSWVVKENDIVYHFYCAVNNISDRRERFIALATSKEIKPNKLL